MRSAPAMLALVLFAGCGDSDAVPPDAGGFDARGDAPQADAPAIDAPDVDAPSPDAPAVDAPPPDAAIDAAPDAPRPELPCPDAGTPALSYSNSYGESYYDSARGVATDGTGSAVITGGFYNTINFGGQPLVDPNIAADDIFVAKFDASGAHVWSMRAGGQNSFDHGESIAVDGQGNVLVAGETGSGADFGGGPVTTSGTSNLFLAKLTSGGAHVWSKGFAITRIRSSIVTNEVLAVAIDGTDHVAIVGHYQGTIDFGGGPLMTTGTGLSDHDAFIVVYDAGGNLVWGRRFGDALFDAAQGAAFDGAGNLIVAGYFHTTIDFGLGAMSTNNGGDDVFVVKFSPTGVPQWNRRYGSGTNVEQRATAVAVDTATGNIALVGDFGGTLDFGGGPIMGTPGSYDVFLAGLDANGNYRFAKRFGDANEQRATGVAFALPTGNIIMSGWFRGSIDFGTCHYIGDATAHRLYAAEFDGSGNSVASVVVAGSGSIDPRSLAVTSTGATILTGTFAGAFDAGLGLLTSVGQTDIFLLRYGSL